MTRIVALVSSINRRAGRFRFRKLIPEGCRRSACRWARHNAALGLHGDRISPPELPNALAQARRSQATLLVAKLDRLALKVAFGSALTESHPDFADCCMEHAKLKIRDGSEHPTIRVLTKSLLLKQVYCDADWSLPFYYTRVGMCVARVSGGSPRPHRRLSRWISSFFKGHASHWIQTVVGLASCALRSVSRSIRR